MIGYFRIQLLIDDELVGYLASIDYELRFTTLRSHAALLRTHLEHVHDMCECMNAILSDMDMPHRVCYEAL